MSEQVSESEAGNDGPETEPVVDLALAREVARQEIAKLCRLMAQADPASGYGRRWHGLWTEAEEMILSDEIGRREAEQETVQE